MGLMCKKIQVIAGVVEPLAAPGPAPATVLHIF